MEYVYRLNAVDIDELVISRKELEKPYINNVDNPSSCGVHYYNVETILKEKYLKYLDISWDKGIVFSKHRDGKGIIHRDGTTETYFCWALNWVWNSAGRLDYWDDEQVPSSVFEPDRMGGFRFRGVTTSPPVKSYIMTPGCYLVNTKRFHLPSTSGPDMRYTLSIRDDSNKFFTWEQTLDYFSKFIVN